jgi:hypothetical protein
MFEKYAELFRRILVYFSNALCYIYLFVQHHLTILLPSYQGKYSSVTSTLQFMIILYRSTTFFRCKKTYVSIFSGTSTARTRNTALVDRGPKIPAFSIRQRSFNDLL